MWRNISFSQEEEQKEEENITIEYNDKFICQASSSFNKLYAQFSEEYLQPIFNKLPPDNKVNDIVKEIVTKQERLKGI